MNKKSCVLLFFLLPVFAFPQVEHANRFLDFLEKNEVDSAYHNLFVLSAEKKSRQPPNLVIDAIFSLKLSVPTTGDTTDLKKRNALKAKRTADEIIARAMADTNTWLKQKLLPLHLLAQADQPVQNTATVIEAANRYIDLIKESSSVYENKTIRYALSLYTRMLPHATMQAAADSLYTAIYCFLRDHQIIANENSTRDELTERAWLRYLFAATNFLRAQQTTDIAEKETLLRNAFTYSPDQLDLRNKAGYFYDQFFIFPKPKESFKEEYIGLIMNSSKSKDSILLAIQQMALAEPIYKKQLSDFYHSVYPTGDFNTYWYNLINSSGKAAPVIHLKDLNGQFVSTETMQKKWILVDFWGTWCIPCKAEHAALQRFYDTLIKANSDKISFLTIACRDTEEAVSTYLKATKYSFPVLMSDTFIEKKFNVQGYPTKALITPNNNYVIIPYNSDWAAYIKQYIGL